MLLLLKFPFPDAPAVCPETWATRNTRSSKDTYPIWNNRFTVSIRAQSSHQQLLFFAVLRMGTETRAIVPLGPLIIWKCHITHNGVKEEISPVQKKTKQLKSWNKMVHKSQQKIKHRGLSSQRERLLVCPRGIRTTICARRTGELEPSRTQLSCLNLT